MPSVLIIDHDPINRKIAGALFSKLNWQVYDTATIEQGMLVLAERQPRLVLIEIMMPGMTGLNICPQLRSRLVDQTAKLIALTAHATEDDRQNFLQRGFDALLLKPLTQKALAATLDSLFA